MFPEITVIVPCYNRQAFLPRLLRSLDDQEIPKEKFTVAIVDDGSDKPIEFDESLYDFEIKLYRHDRNMGLPTALNTALKNITTRFFVRIDSDDYVHKSFLKVLRLKFELEPSVFAVALDYQKVDESERIISINSCEKEPIGCAIMFRTEIIKQIGLYDEKMLLAEEIDFRNRVVKFFKIHRIALPLYRYVQHNGNMTNDEDLYNYYRNNLSD